MDIKKAREIADLVSEINGNEKMIKRLIGMRNDKGTKSYNDAMSYCGKLHVEDLPLGAIMYLISYYEGQNEHIEMKLQEMKLHESDN